MTDEEKQDVERDDTEKNAEDTEDTKEEQSDSSSQETDKDAEIAKLQTDLKASNEARDKLYARLKRQESKDSDASDKDKSDDKKGESAPGLTREEAILYARGHSLEEVEKAKKIAAIEETDILKAAETDLFTTWKAKKDKEAKDAAAQLPPSRGGKPQVKKTFGTKGLSDDEHKELFNEKVGR